MLNVVLVLMLTTSVLGPFLTERFAPRLLDERNTPGRSDPDAPGTPTLERASADSDEAGHALNEPAPSEQREKGLSGSPLAHGAAQEVARAKTLLGAINPSRLDVYASAKAA